MGGPFTYGGFIMWGDKAFTKLITDYTFETVLDIGSGAGDQARAFRRSGKKVTAIDFGSSCYYDAGGKDYDNIEFIKGDFADLAAVRHFDCVWASHVLEHQRNPGFFLEQCFQLTHKVFAVTVPPLKHEIVGGHVSLWNAGMLLYNMILAGFDCSQAAVWQYGYNISVIVSKKEVDRDVLKQLHYDHGDIVRLQKYFPIQVREGFNGQNIKVNWGAKP